MNDLEELYVNLNYNGKCNNAHPITFRSSWERIFSNWCDLNENVIEWRF